MKKETRQKLYKATTKMLELMEATNDDFQALMITIDDFKLFMNGQTGINHKYTIELNGETIKEVETMGKEFSIFKQEVEQLFLTPQEFKLEVL